MVLQHTSMCAVCVCVCVKGFARLSGEFNQLLIGCQVNRERWAEMAERGMCKMEQDNADRENKDKDEDDVMSTPV